MPPRLICHRCGTAYPLEPMFHGCVACAAAGHVGPLFVEYDAGRIKAAWTGGHAASGAMWTYAPVLPLEEGAAPVALGEGGTPLRRMHGRAAASGGALGDGEVWLKLETANPTGSYKDRLNSVATSVARRQGFRGIACTSTGNHGVSLAAYAAAAGLRSVILLPHEAPVRAVEEIQASGGTALVMPWDERGRWLDWLVDEAGWAVSARNFPRRLGNPYGIEGYKTIAYEIVRQMDGRAPAVVFMPTGGGDGIYGAWRGFRELLRAGIIDRAPRMMACQPLRSASVARAFRSGAAHVAPVDLVLSCAVSLTDRQGGDHALWAIRESGGAACALTEEEIRSAVHLLEREGVSVEPAGAASVAGYLSAGVTDGPVVCVLTGRGQRWSLS